MRKKTDTSPLPQGIYNDGYHDGYLDGLEKATELFEEATLTEEDVEKMMVELMDKTTKEVREKMEKNGGNASSG